MAYQQNSLATKVSLSFSCKGLRDRDLTSKSDPIIQLMMLNSQGNWREIGRTEHIMNTHDPDFAQPIDMDYFFEEVQKLKIMVYDVDNATQTLGDDDFLGRHECTLGQIVSSKVYTKELSYKSGSKAGTVTVVAEEKSGSTCNVTFQFHGENLDKKDLLSKSDPYLEIAKDARGDGTYTVVHRNKYLNNTLNPKWPPFTIDLHHLCSGDYDMKLKIRCFDHDEDDENDLIGEFETSLNEMSKASNENENVIKCFDYDDDGSHDLIGEFYTSMKEMCNNQQVRWDCINPKKQQKKKNYKNSGVIVLDSIRVDRVASFLEYVMSGCQINFTVGVDFTASNGDPRTPQSLHYMDPNQPNEYVKALVAVGEVCQDYDSDKMFPALGFGAKIPPQYQVSFEFPLNFNPQNPYCQGIHNIVAAYQSCLRQIQLYGPTNVAPIINHVRRFAEATLSQHPPNTASNYFVLLLLTDGVISDMDETVASIVDASYLPISLIIVGVGNADFDQMDFLDCDNGKLRSNRGKEAMRDIVQFVPFRDFRKAPPPDLAKAVLAEVPKQVTDYFRMKRIAPNVPPQ